MAKIQSVGEVIKGKRGGKRNGAGRKGLSYAIANDPRYLAARGYNPLMAAEILQCVVDERRIWKRILESQDDRVVLQALQFLMSMRDGKPAQQINVTSTNVTLNVSEIERARAIVREIRGDVPSLGPLPLGTELPSGTPVDSHGTVGEDDTPVVDLVTREEKANIMLCGDEGGRKDGVG